VVKIVAGDPVKAHRAGVEASSQLYGVPVKAAADIVITDSHPMDSDLRQGVKALANTVRALKPGGVIITLVRAEEGVGVFGLANTKLPLGRKALQFLAPVLLPLVPRLKIKGLGEEDRFFLYFALQACAGGICSSWRPRSPKRRRATCRSRSSGPRLKPQSKLPGRSSHGKRMCWSFPAAASLIRKSDKGTSIQSNNNQQEGSPFCCFVLQSKHDRD